MTTSTAELTPLIAEYGGPVPFAPLTANEALLRYGEACRAQARYFERHGICDAWRSAARDADALHWRVYLSLKSIERAR